MFNIANNNLLLSLQSSTSASTPLAAASMDSSGMPSDMAGLFSMMLSGQLQQLDGQLQPQLFDGQQLDGASLAALLEGNPELQAAIPDDLLMNFIKSGGQDSAELEALIANLTGTEIKLDSELSDNLNHALILLEQKGHDSQALMEQINVGQLNLNGIQLAEASSEHDTDLKFVDVKAENKGGAVLGAMNQQLSQLHAKLTKLQTMPEGSKQYQQLQREISTDAKQLFQGAANDGANKLALSQLLQEEDPKALIDTIAKDVLKGDTFLKQLQQMMSNRPVTAGQSQNSNPAAMLVNGLAPFTPASPDSPILVRPLQVMAPVGQGEWTQQFNDQVLWLGSQQIKSAAIKVTPAELGPVEVNIKVINDKATIQFHSHSGQVRELIEQAMPKLREMMHDQGIQLADVDVQDNSQQQAMRKQSEQQQGNKEGQAAFNPLEGEEGYEQQNEALVSEVVQRVQQGLVDFFA